MSDGDSNLNVYEIWMAGNGAPEGVWIKRTTWSSVCARITSIGPVKGPAPYFGNPRVTADLFFLDGTLKQRSIDIPAPGTFKTWRKIPPPTWWPAALKE